jgi:hypothetical protein
LLSHLEIKTRLHSQILQAKLHLDLDLDKNK